MKSIDKKFYEKLAGRKLSTRKASDAKSNFVGFFELLYYIEQKNNKRDQFKK